jgi:hypothetical protein
MAFCAYAFANLILEGHAGHKCWVEICRSKRDQREDLVGAQQQFLELEYDFPGAHVSAWMYEGLARVCVLKAKRKINTIDLMVMIMKCVMRGCEERS